MDEFQKAFSELRNKQQSIKLEDVNEDIENMGNVLFDSEGNLKREIIIKA